MSEILYDRPRTEKDSFIQDAVESIRHDAEFEQKVADSYSDILSSDPDKIREGVSFILEVSNFGWQHDGNQVTRIYQGGITTEFNNRDEMTQQQDEHTAKSVSLFANAAYRGQWAELLFDRRADPIVAEITTEIRKQTERKNSLINGRNDALELRTSNELTVDRIIETEESLEAHRETVAKLEKRHAELLNIGWDKKSLENLDIYDVLSCTHDSQTAYIDGTPVAVTTIGGIIDALVFRTGAALDVEITILNLKESLINVIETGTPTEWYTLAYDKIDQRYEHTAYIDDRSIEELELGIRSYNCLKRAGIGTLGKLLELTEDQLNTIPNFGPRCTEDVRETLNRLGLSLRSEEQ